LQRVIRNRGSTKRALDLGKPGKYPAHSYLASKARRSTLGRRLGQGNPGSIGIFSYRKNCAGTLIKISRVSFHPFSVAQESTGVTAAAQRIGILKLFTNRNRHDPLPV
jgi:hypothetical protein